MKYPTKEEILAVIEEDITPVSVSDLCTMFRLPVIKSANSAIRSRCHALAKDGLIREEKVYIKDNIYKMMFSPLFAPEPKPSLWVRIKNWFK